MQLTTDPSEASEAEEKGLCVDRYNWTEPHAPVYPHKMSCRRSMHS